MSLIGNKMCETNVKSIENKSGRTYMQWMVAVLASTAFLNYGMQMGWASPMKKVLQSENSPSGAPLSDTEIAWIASIMPLSAAMTTFLYAYIADTYGRKIGIIAMFVPQLLCWIIKLLSVNTYAIIIARLFAGLPAGGCFTIIPMYVKEISQDNIRGTLVTLTMTFQNIGYLAMYAMGSYLDYYVILWIVVCLPVVSLIMLVAMAPESPAFLVKKGKFEKAAKIVARLRCLDVNDKIVQNEIEYAKRQDEHSKTNKNITLLSIFQNKAWVYGIYLSSFTMTALDLNGTMCITQYAWSILTTAGVTLNPELQTLSIPIIMIIGSLASAACVEKLGRKPILVGGFMLGMVSQASLATTMYLQAYSEVTIPGWVPILAIVGCVLAYSAGILPMIYVVLAEIFPYEVRAKLISLIVAYGWAVTFVQVFSYYPISNAFGTYTTFYLFASSNLIGAVGCLIFQPETMGKSVKQIEQIFLGKKDVAM